MKASSRKTNLFSKIETMLDVPQGSFRDLPNIIFYGTEKVEIDNFKGLLDFSPNSVRVNTSDGIIRIDGINLIISVMTDDCVCINGCIRNLSFE